MPDTNMVLHFVFIWLVINCKMDMIWVFNTVALIILLCKFSSLVVYHQLISPHFEILAWKQEQIKSGWQFFLGELFQEWVRILESKRDVWQLEHSGPLSFCLWGGILRYQGCGPIQPRWYPNPTQDIKGKVQSQSQPILSDSPVDSPLLPLLLHRNEQNLHNQGPSSLYLVPSRSVQV